MQHLKFSENCCILGIRHAVSSKVQDTVKVRKLKKSLKFNFNSNPFLKPRYDFCKEEELEPIRALVDQLLGTNPDAKGNAKPFEPPQRTPREEAAYPRRQSAAAIEQTLEGSFLAASKRKFARKYAFESSIFRIEFGKLPNSIR